MKYRIAEPVSVAIGPGPEMTFKAGVQEPKGEAERAAFEHLVKVGLAERVRAAEGEGES